MYACFIEVIMVTRVVEFAAAYFLPTGNGIHNLGMPQNV